MLFPQLPPRSPIISHTPGIFIWMNGSQSALQLFPTHCSFYSDPLQNGALFHEIDFSLQGPISRWTVKFFPDTETVEVSGHEIHGSFFSYTIQGSSSGLHYAPKKGLQDREAKKIAIPHPGNAPLSKQTSRLDLGGYKAMVWETRIRSLATNEGMRELIQEWYSFGDERNFNEAQVEELLASQTLLGELARAVFTPAQGERKALFFIRALVETALNGIFVIKPHDDRYLGYSLPPLPEKMTTSEFHTAVSFLLRRLIYGSQRIDTLELMPGIYGYYPSGRVWNASLFDGKAKMSYEWRQKKARRIVLSSQEEMSLRVISEPRIAFGSLRQEKKSSRKKTVSFDKPLHLKPHIEYLCDNFSFVS